MTEHVPRDAQVVARILQRAGELERTAVTHQDRVSPIAEASMLAAAEEVGLSVDAVRRSIAIERLGPVPAARPGDRLVGPARVYADAQVDTPASDALARVDAWLVDGHHLRRDALRPGHGAWSKRSGVVGVTVRTIRNATGEGKLGDVERIDAAALETGNGASVVRITVDRTNGRRIAAGGGAAVAVTGATGAVVAAVAAAPVVLLSMPVVAAAGVGVALVGRRRARQTEREIRRLLDAVGAGADPTRLSVDVVRRAAGTATAAGSRALRGAGRRGFPPPPPLEPPALEPPPLDLPHLPHSTRPRLRRADRRTD